MAYSSKSLKQYIFFILLILSAPIIASLVTSLLKINIVETFECWCRQDAGHGGLMNKPIGPVLPAYTQLLGSPVTLTSPKQVVAPLPTFGNPFAYTLSFWLKVPDNAPGWRNVLRFGPDDSHRMPAVYITPTALNIHYRHATTDNGNPGFDGIPGMQANTWTHFAMSVSGRVLTPYLNGVAGTPMTMTGDLLLPTDQVYMPGDPATYVDPAHLISLGYVWFFPTALGASDIANVYKAAHAGAQ